MHFRAKFFPAAFVLATGTPLMAQAEDGPSVALVAELTSDTVTVASGGIDHKVRYLQNLDLVADLDLDRVVGIAGTTLHVDLLHNAGAFANNAVGALQCIDNIEVWKPKLRLYEAWVQKDLGKGASLRAGVMDLNAEFYTNPAAGLLIAPPFGIGSELAATGPAGPSIFPMTAMGARVAQNVGKSGYIRAGIYNARPGLHAGGVGSSFKFDKGVLAIAQAGVGTAQNVSVGLWSYSRRQTNFWQSLMGGFARPAHSQGAYMMVEQPLLVDGDRKATAFARAGVSDGKTSLFKGSWQAGLLVSGMFKGRPYSQGSIGVAQGALTGGFADFLVREGTRPARAESMVELTYSDRIAPFLTVQPDILYIVHPGGDARARDALVLNLRFTFRFAHAR